MDKSVNNELSDLMVSSVFAECLLLYLYAAYLAYVRAWKSEKDQLRSSRRGDKSHSHAGNHTSPIINTLKGGKIRVRL